jgi:hypothetical protein
MSKLDDDIRKVLADGDAAYDLEREEGVFRQVAGLFRGRMRWMAIVATIYAVAIPVLMVLAAIRFFQSDDTRWQIFYATGVLLLGMLLVLVKLWGWTQMTRNSLQRDIRRLELRMLELVKEARH